MKRILILLILSVFTVLQAGAQMPGGMRGGMPKLGKVYGKIVDSKSGRAIDAASVLFLQVQNGKDVLVKNTLTESNGEFSFDELPMMGQFKITVIYTGYKQYEAPVAFDLGALMKAGAAMKGTGSGDFSTMTSVPGGATDLLNALSKDLGTIRVEALNEQLSGVTVTAAVPTFTLQGEKKIFNVDKNLTSQGGTAQDVMKNVPGVLVDADGKVTIRNSSPQLLIDGKQSPLQLDQIPADAIESVEIVTNPSAKYDAEGGTGGVLNIVLKKNRKTGYNGGIRAGVDSRGGGNLGADFNYRTGKVNLSLVGHSNLMRNRLTGSNERTDFSTDPNQRNTQDDVNTTRGGFAFGRVGLDYFVSNRTTISLGYVKVHGEFKPTDNLDITTDSLYPSGISTAWSQRHSEGKNQFDMNGVQLGMKHLFRQPGREWTFDASANMGKNSNDNRYTTTLYNDNQHTDASGLSSQRTAGSGQNNFYTIQSDYVQPMRKSDKLELGVKATIRQVKSDIDNYVSFNNGPDTLIPNVYSRYKNLDQVYAAYASYSGNIDANTSYQLGLRAEGSQYEGTLEMNNQTFSNAYPVSLFPSVFVSRKLKKDQQLQFTYRRGINRPNFFQLLPYTDYTDPLNIRQGNPGLKPEFTNTVEATYMKNFTRINYVMVSVYYRHSSNLITQYQDLGTNPFTGDQALISSYINANSSDRYGIELTSGWDITKWWNALANVNVYNATLNTGEAGTTSSTNSYLSGFGKLTNNFKLPKKLSFQLSGVYQSRTNLLPDAKNDGPGGGRGGGFMMQSNSSSQGYLEANWSVDAALRWSFLKGDAASLSLSVNDIFGTRRFTQHTEDEYFVQDYSRLVNPQLVRLNFSFRFGKMDTDLFRRKNIKGQMEGMQDASQNIGM